MDNVAGGVGELRDGRNGEEVAERDHEAHAKTAAVRIDFKDLCSADKTLEDEIYNGSAQSYKEYDADDVQNFLTEYGIDDVSPRLGVFRSH